MKFEIEIKNEKVYYEYKIGTSKESGNFEVDLDNYFLIAEVIHCLKRNRDSKVASFKNGILDKFIKEEISKRSKEDRSGE